MWLIAIALSALASAAIAQCPAGWSSAGTPASWCYGKLPAKAYASAYLARKDCLAQGADLVRIKDVEAHQKIGDLLKSITGQVDIYINVHYGTGAYKYLTSTDTVSNTKSLAGTGSGYCFVMTTSNWTDTTKGNWKKVACCSDISIQHVVCEKPISGTTAVTDANNILYQQCMANHNACGANPCKNGGVCENVKPINNAYTCKCPAGKTGTNCETELLCPSVTLSTYANADYTVPTSFVPGTTNNIIITCKSGYFFEDKMTKKTVNCDASGQWLPNVLQGCTKHCPTIPTILNAKVGNIGTAIGHTVNYTCTIGYQFPDNTTAMNLTCLQNGEWSVATKDLPICDVVKCPELKKFSHQSMNTRNNTYNTTIIFWCDVGYALSDNTTARTIKCTETGKWSANLPPCEPIKCKHIKPVAKGYRNSSNNVFDTFVEYRCNSGFRMEDGAAWRIIKCDATGEWSDNVTDCALNRCYPLPYVANATPSTLVAELNTEVTFKCIQGHKFFTTKADTQTIICKSDNIRLRWTPNLKGCEPIQCPILSTEITNQNLKNLGPATEARLYGSVVAIKCHKGHYKPDNTSTEVVECLSTEKWNLTTYKECDPVKCLGPPAMDNGTHSRNTYSRTTFEYLNLVYYQCKSQHKFLDGRTTRNITCNEFGKWNESDLSCRKDRCDPIPLLANVKPNTTQTNWYTVVKYTCQDGFEWTQGTKQVIVDCTDTGVWNNENALKPCTAKVCPTMPTQTNSSHNGTKTPTTYVYGDYVEHRCDTGYIYKKNKAKAMVMNCNSQGKWEPATLDKCEPIVCGELDQIDNATLQTNDTHFGIDIVYKCNDGYQFPDKDREKTVRCQAGENDTVGHYEWFKFKTQNPAKMANHCEVVFCPPVPAWTEREFNSTENEFTSVVMYWCKDKYTFETCDSAKDNYANCEKATKLITTVEETVLEMTTAAGNDSGGGGLTTKTVKRTESTCVEAKVWDPPFLDCVPIKSIGEGVKGVVTESKDGPTFGIFAISLLVVTGITLVLLDLNKLWTDIQLMRKNIKDFMNKRKKNKVTDSSVSIPDSTA